MPSDDRVSADEKHSGPERSVRRGPRWLRLLKKLPAETLVGCVRCYQRLLSPLLGRNCRFSPSCSQYVIESVRKYGMMRGSFRGLRRIARCHPFHPGGYDPP